MTAALRRFTAPAPRRPTEQQCEMCSERLGHNHSHVVNVETRSILCACRGCYLLFTHPGAGGGKHRAVPERYRHLPSFPAGELIWESTGIPVGMAFLFRSSPAGPVAFYPSPGGATESLLEVNAWEQAVGQHPALSDIADDVEALLINQGHPEITKQEGKFECFLVPVDVCYQLVGLVRMYWRGFDGGSEVRQHLDEFFDTLRRRCERVETDADRGR